MLDTYWLPKEWLLWWDFALNNLLEVLCIHYPKCRHWIALMLWNFCSWTSTRTMTLGDVPESTAVDNPAFRLVNRTFLVQALWKYTAPDVKIFTTLGPSIKVVSFKISFFLFCDIIYFYLLLTFRVIKPEVSPDTNV